MNKIFVDWVCRVLNVVNYVLFMFVVSMINLWENFWVLVVFNVVNVFIWIVFGVGGFDCLFWLLVSMGMLCCFFVCW